MKLSKSIYLFMIVGMLAQSGIALAEEQVPVTVDQWLIAPPVRMPVGVLDPDSTLSLQELILSNPPVNPGKFLPEDGMEISLTPERTVRFSVLRSSTVSFQPLPDPGEDEVFFGSAGTYMNVPVWGELEFEVTGRAPFRLFLDGAEVLSRSSGAESDTTVEKGTENVDQGFHRILLISAVGSKDSLDTWSLSLSIVPREKQGDGSPPTFTLDPRHDFDFDDYYLIDGVNAIEVSRDGRWAALIIAPWDKENDRREPRLEVWDLKKRQRIWEYVNPDGVSNPAWSPDSGTLLFTTESAEKGADVFLWNRESRGFERIMHEIERGGSYTWSPDGATIYFTRTVPFEKDEDKPYKAMWGLEDRWSSWRDDTEIHYLTLQGRVRGVLTHGKYDPDSFIISPDGSTILMLRWVTLSDRPFLGAEFWTISTLTGEARRVLATGLVSVGHISFSPDGGKVAFTAPVNPVEGMDSPYPDNNDNQTDIWTLDLTTGELVNHTRDFEPAIAGLAYGSGFRGSFFWHDDGKIGFTGLYNKKVKLYFFDPESGKIEEHPLPTPAGTNGNASLGRKGSMFVYQGSLVEHPGDIYWYDWKKKKGGVLETLHPEYKRLIERDFRVIDFDYQNSDGVTIPGYLYYPSGYDPAKEYPLVVDFYGGVFGYADGFLWMPNVFAGRGYFVYVPTPRGAAGWGQKFADNHPNDWGVKTSRDINEGVRKIVAEIPGVDGAKCAPVSGSYGGFMTMYLLSMPKDDPDYYPYATGISDYGISNLASYWGVGWWGYLYSDMATARNFPWNNPEYYIEHSPLYRANNITVPLLLLHGDADVNVPPMESDQMYTALKVLGREVEFLRFPGENHGIASKRQKYLLTKRIHVEWFDKYLRNLPEAWDYRMKDEKKK